MDAGLDTWDSQGGSSTVDYQATNRCRPCARAPLRVCCAVVAPIGSPCMRVQRHQVGVIGLAKSLALNSA
jgi:hypothetical protein